jgi:acetylornithine/N-succinyldiaminopimelate aminotransferase
MTTMKTIETEDKYAPGFFKKIPISIDRGEGCYVWDEEGKRYLDFSAGWGVTCLGHSHPVILKALEEQSRKIMQNPNSGLTYSPARARLLELLVSILPAGLTRVFFSNSGAESNDAAIKLARKVTGRRDVISTELSFHGRTISTASATGQVRHRERFDPLMPNYRFVPYDNIEALGKSMDDEVAAVILEPIQGEGGIRVPHDGYLEAASDLCKRYGALLIIDEIQTGFFRTGPAFAISPLSVEADFLTMAKGIGGGFPFGAFAMAEHVARKVEQGDHGGTYSGNPLGCAVSYAVIRYLLDNGIDDNVKLIGEYARERLNSWIDTYPGIVQEVRGKGLLLIADLVSQEWATKVVHHCLENGLFVSQTQSKMIRIFPPLNITRSEMDEGLDILERSLEVCVKNEENNG